MPEHYRLIIKTDTGIPKIGPARAMALMKGFKQISTRPGADLHRVVIVIQADPQSIVDLRALVGTVGIEAEVRQPRAA